MLALAIDTAAELGSIALVEGGRVLEETTLQPASGYGEILFAELEKLLQRSDVKLRDIDIFAAASGPGSFTGVRIGLAAIKGLAEVCGKPAAGVSNLEALASLAEGRGLRAPVIDARRGEIYAALFDESGNALIPETVLPQDSFTALTADYQFERISPPRALAAAIARIAMRRPQDPAAIEANYVRRADAELLWRS